MMTTGMMVMMTTTMRMPGLLCYVKADRSFPLDIERAGGGRGGYQRGRRCQKHGHARGVWSEDRDCPELNSLLQIGAAVFQVEQSRGAASPMITLSNSTERMCSRAQPRAQCALLIARIGQQSTRHR